MFAPKPFSIFRMLGIVAVIALVAVVTAFNYEAGALPLPPNPFADDEASSAEVANARPDAAVDAGAQPQFHSVGDFVAPVEIIERTGDERFFVVSLMGAVVASDGTTQTTILDISDRVVVAGELGLLGAAFHPEGDRLYVHYGNDEANSVIAEFQVDPSTAIADPATRRELMVVEQPFDNHNGGELAFGPDGYLYAGFGDGGLADDPNRLALDLSTPLGKILRIDPTPSAALPYTVPDDNPFVGDPAADPTIWSYGLRNPWRFSFDAETSGLWIADVGQNQWEEVNGVFVTDQPAGYGLSFGWSAFEADARFNEDQPADGHTQPFFTYARADGRCSISGGAVYRNASDPSLDGWYVYGDYCTGEILAFDTDASAEDRDVVTLGQLPGVVAIALGPDGDLFAASVMGHVLRLG